MSLFTIAIGIVASLFVITVSVLALSAAIIAARKGREE